MNVEIATEAAQFPEKEYINGIFVSVQARNRFLGSYKGLQIRAPVRWTNAIKEEKDIDLI
jgi:hypothetical protein